MGKQRMTNGARAGIRQFLFYIALSLAAVFVLYPLVFVLMSSLKTNIDVISNPFGMKSINFSNYIDAWRIGKVGQYFLNSVIVTFITLSCQVIIITLASYAIGKLKPWGSGILFNILLMSMFVTSEMTTVPNYMTLRNLGFLNSYAGLVIPYTAGGLMMGTYILTNFIRTLPKELDEAALIDGAGIFRIMFRVDIPLVLPAMATLVIFNFNGVWSEFYWALITIKDEAIKTLPLGLINFASQYTSNYGVLSAGLTILTLPVVIVYLIFSQYFIAGISAGALKG
jgi:raffinose/stachyose/melibiose transport system permease protein